MRRFRFEAVLYKLGHEGSKAQILTARDGKDKTPDKENLN